MADVDGSFTDPDGRKKSFVSLRPGESSEEFAARAVGICFAMSDILPLERVVMSGPHDWEKLTSSRRLEARLSADPTIHLRVTVLPSAGGGSLAHLVVDHADQPVFDDWGDSQDDGSFLPRADDGRISKWSAALWRLAHQIRGIGDLYDERFERAGLVVETSW